jgi:hypothetical protein
MGSVLEIEQAIHALDPSERWKLLERFNERMWEEWDRQIEGDVKAGRLDALIAEAKSEVAQGKARPLHEILHD